MATALGVHRASVEGRVALGARAGNEKTAKSLGLTIPPSLLLRADEVIR